MNLFSMIEYKKYEPYTKINNSIKDLKAISLFNAKKIDIKEIMIYPVNGYNNGFTFNKICLFFRFINKYKKIIKGINILITINWAGPKGSKNGCQNAIKEIIKINNIISSNNKSYLLCVLL
jgi:hypothetical protein